MAELHQVLAVDKDIEAIARKIRTETIVTFTKKTELFSGHLKTLNMFDDARAGEAEALTETKKVTTTVPDRLKYTTESLVRYFDCLLHKEGTNQLAKADVIVDNQALLKDVPATMLLAMERELKLLREMYETIPTLAPGVDWETDPNYGDHIWKTTTPRKAHRTEKTLQVISLAKATKEHKEQVQVQSVDVPVGQWTQHNWSGLIHPVDKSKLLGRVDNLIQAVKTARSVANKQEVIDVKNFGSTIMKYINEPLVD